MNTLQKALENQLSLEIPASLVVEILCAKLAEKGVRLSPRQRKRLKEGIKVDDFSEIQIPSWRFWERKRVLLEISDGDVKRIEESLDNLITRVPDLVVGLSNDLADTVLVDLRRGWRRQAAHEGRTLDGFRRRLEKRWGEALSRLAMLLTIALETGGSVNDRLRASASTRPHLVETQTRLHARACQIAAEVLTLLRGGFSDGAMARWRTLHEVAVVSMLVTDDQIAERYLLHDAIESRRANRDYQEHAERLGIDPMAPEDIASSDNISKDLIDRFGSAFGEQYGWASERLGKKSPSFLDIERAVGLDHLRPYYRLASHNVHANPKGALFRLGLLRESDLLLAGPSNFGLADPGQCVAISLLQATSALVMLDTTLDHLVAIKIMATLTEEVQNLFAAAQADLEGDAGTAKASPTASHG